MKNTLRWKWVVITAIVVACIVGVTGLPTSGQQLAANLNRNVRLGLDLKGGSHIVLQVQVQDAFKAVADTAIESLRQAFEKEKVSYTAMERNDPPSIESAATIQILIKGVPATQTSNLRRVVSELLDQQWVLTGVTSTDYQLNMRKEASINLTRDTLKQSIDTMERKVNGLGVAEASVQYRGGSGGDTEMLIQLPGVDDPVRVKSILQTAALLELYEVKDGPFANPEQARLNYGGTLPLNSKIIRSAARANEGEAYYVVSRSPVITGRDLRNARPQQGEMGGWETSFTLSQDAARKFGRFTETHIGKRLAIVLDNNVRSAPVIENRIEDSGRITGASSQEDASDLALLLRSGSLPAGVKVIEERTVGPSLGADSIRRGVSSGLLGLALVVASMLLYYRGAGFNAILALLLNTIITIAALSYFDATWTLPGIAGLILSIGMAVDSNVLIFERIKEEMRSGKAVPVAISAGFDRALVTIIDTHVTTVVASAFLFIFGTGPVRGFAVTLVVGLVANLFTAVFVSRAIFDIKIFRNPRLSHLSIGKELFGETNLDFLSRRTLTLGLSVAAIVVSIGSLVMKGGPKQGLDFRGGTLIYARFDPMPPIDDLRRALSEKLQGEISVLEDRRSGEFIIGTELADERKLDQTRQAVQDVLRDKYANLGGKLDLNNASQAALEGRLQGANVPLGREELKSLTTRILAYRDRDRSGVIRNLDELSSVSGVDQRVLAAIKQECGVGSFNLRSVEIVGPRAGEELRKRALWATLSALGGMLIYIAFRFQWISGTAAVIATIHDVIITLGLFSLTDREINLNIIAALLTLIGYSMNDKIVVFDRVRENMRTKRRVPFLELVNHSINQTLSRTLLTAGPTLLACLSLYFLGGEVLNGIAFALFIGIIVGTYSSIFVASALLVMWQQFRFGGSADEVHGQGAGRGDRPRLLRRG
ncbi:MAG: protein translocase subunit SecD [Acidobacteria bacterium]|nr:protein translocase subunit SecD [Acidobacteriota bacterium]